MDIVPNQHYFDVLGQLFISYPPWLDWVIWVLVLLLIGFSSFRAMRSKEYHWPHLLHGLACAFLSTALPALMIFVLDRFLSDSVTSAEIIARQRGWFIAWALFACGFSVWIQGSLQTGLNSRSRWLMALVPIALALLSGVGWVLVTVVAAITMLLVLLLRRPPHQEMYVIGGQWALALFAFLTLMLLEGGAYVLIWSLLSVALLLAWRWRWRWRSNENSIAPAVWLLALLPAIVMLGSTALLFDLMVGFNLPVVAILPILFLMQLMPPLMVGNSVRLSGICVAFLGIAGLSWLSLTSPWSNKNPQPTELFVLHDADNQSTYWASEDLSLTSWHKETLGLKPIQQRKGPHQPNKEKAVWLTPIQGAEVSVPQLKLLAADKKQQLLSVQLIPGQPGDSITVWLPPETNLQQLQVDGLPLPWKKNTDGQWISISGFALPTNGVTLTMTFDNTEDWPELHLVAQHNGLPDSVELPSRGSNFSRRSNSYSDSTVTFKRVRLDSFQ